MKYDGLHYHDWLKISKNMGVKDEGWIEMGLNKAGF